VVLQSPERTEAITIRLTPREKERLTQVALTQDQRVGQLARRFINAALDTKEDAPRDGHAAH